MTLQEYQQLAKRTDIRTQTADMNMRLVCSILGLFEEIKEFQSLLLDKCVNLMKLTEKEKEAVLSEASDIIWYISDICTELGVALEDLPTTPPDNKINAFKIFKKTFRDYNGSMPDHYRKDIIDYLGILLHLKLPKFVCIEEAMVYNIAKLQDRYTRGVIQGDGDTR
jgi:hypothetical protein